MFSGLFFSSFPPYQDGVRRRGGPLVLFLALNGVVPVTQGRRPFFLFPPLFPFFPAPVSCHKDDAPEGPASLSARRQAPVLVRGGPDFSSLSSVVYPAVRQASLMTIPG